MPAQSRRHRRKQAARSYQNERRSERRALEAVDFAVDYSSVGYDLKRITAWSIVLFIGMFVFYFVV